MPDPSFREDGSAPPAHSRHARGEFRPEPVLNPPPRFLSVAYRVAPERLFDAAMEALKGAGVSIREIRREDLFAGGSEGIGGGLEAAVTLSVQETATGGGRAMLTYDRPPGTPFDPRIDERRLQELMAKVDEALARAAS